MSAYRVLQLSAVGDDPWKWVEQRDDAACIDLPADYVDRDALDALGEKYGPGKFLLLSVEPHYGETKLIELEIAAKTAFEEVTS